MREEAASTGKKPSAGAYACILLSAVFWGIIGFWNRGLRDAGLSAGTMVVLRNLGGMLLLMLLFGVRDRSIFRLHVRDLKYFIGSGTIGVGFLAMCYFSCQRMCSLAVASVLLSIYPSIVVLLSAAVWKEPVTKKKLVALCMTLLGSAMVCGVFDAELSATVPGILLGLGSAFFCALYSVFSRCALDAGYKSEAVTMWTFAFALPGSLLLFRPSELVQAAGDPFMWVMLAGLVVVSTVLPYYLYAVGLSRVEAGKAAIMSSLDPVTAALMGVLVFSEPFTATTGLGILCALTGVYILR